MAFAQGLLDAGAPVAILAQVVGGGDLFEWQETMTVTTVVDECRFQTGLDAGDNGLVDITLALFLTGGFNV